MSQQRVSLDMLWKCVMHLHDTQIMFMFIVDIPDIEPLR